MVGTKVEHPDTLSSSKTKDHTIFLIYSFFSVFLSEIYSGVFKVVGLSKVGLILITLYVCYRFFDSTYKRRITDIINFMERWKKSEIEKLKNTEIDNTVNSKKLNRKNRGLIALISIPPGKKTKEQWFAECKKEIDQYPKNEKEILGLPGIGQTFRAILHHKDKLDQIWLVHSEKSQVNIEIIEYFLNKVMTHKVTVVPVIIYDTEDVVSIKEKIDGIYKKLPEELTFSDVISDITGGTKSMTAAMVLACLHQEKSMEYVEQNKNELIEVEVSPKFAGLEF